MNEEKNPAMNETEYVMVDPGITNILNDNTLRLTIERTGETLQFQKDVIEAGRSKNCDFCIADFRLQGALTVPRSQAAFFYENGMWFLCDKHTANGTRINGVKIQPGKKYQLVSNDVINFAAAENIIFDKNDNLENFEKEIAQTIMENPIAYAKKVVFKII